MRSKEEIERQVKDLREEIRVLERMYVNGDICFDTYTDAMFEKKNRIRVLKYALGEFEWLDVVCYEEV